MAPEPWPEPEFPPLGDWRSTMPVWAHRELWKIRENNWEYLNGKPTGPILGGVLMDEPSKMLFDETLVGPSLTYLIRVQSDRGLPLDLLLWGDTDRDWARWTGETEEERAAAKWPNDDVITGYPDHYIVNGDTSTCGCPEHFSKKKA